MLSKSLIQFSVDGRGCVPSLLFDLRPNSGGGNEDNGDLLQKIPCTHCYTRYPQPCSRPPPTHASARDSWTLTGKSGSVSCGVAALFSWVLVHTRFCLCPPRVYFLVLFKFWLLYGGVNGDLVIANAIFQQHKRRLYTWTLPDGQYQNQIDYILCSQRWRSSIQSAKTRLRADCGSDRETLLPNSDLN